MPLAAFSCRGQRTEGKKWRELRTKMVIDLTGNLTGQANKMTNALTGMGRHGSRSMQVLSRSVHAVSSGLDRIGNRYTALLTGAVGIGAVKSVGDLSQRLAYLGINAEASREEIDKLYASILDISMKRRVDPSGLLGGVESIVRDLGDLDYAKANLDNIALAMSAAGAAGKEVGSLVGNFKQKFNLKDSTTKYCRPWTC